MLQSLQSLVTRPCWFVLVREIRCCRHSNVLKNTIDINMDSFKLYPSLQSILEDLNKHSATNTAVTQLLDVYNSVDNSSKNSSSSKTRHPLIVIEGLDGSGKSTVTKSLAKKLGAKLFCTPPPILHKLRNLFDDTPSFRSAYYSLGNYVAGLQLEEMLKESPVILDRFWHSTVAYAIAERIKRNSDEFQMPPEGSDIYNWPADLIKPDAVFFLSVCESVRLSRLSHRVKLTSQENEIQRNNIFRKNIISAYLNMREPSVEKINANAHRRVVVDNLFQKVRHLLVRP